ncbi:MAG: nitroreductase family protein [Hahellaceae bacterium]|nr:nitroreductase family protein [Hahellaceae bacterium]MCP5211803.1 nitroreductase family protein [Hahellaceae bacterium]
MNTVTESLQKRVSFPRLTSPAPAGETLTAILKCALRAPDHALLRPWRFMVYQESSLNQLTDIFVAAGEAQENMDELQMNKLRSMAHRAPMVIVCVASYQDHPKVPRQEQLLSAGCAVAYMLAAIQAEGFGAIWRTGPMATDPIVCSGLGLSESEEIVGFLYVGTPLGDPKTIPEIPLDQFFVFK